MNKERLLKLFAKLSPEEQQEMLNELSDKETTGNESGEQPQNDLKATDKVGSSETPREQETEAPQSVEVKGDKQEQVSASVNDKDTAEETHTEQEQPQAETESKQEGALVGDTIDNDPSYDAIALNDLVSKDYLSEVLKTLESKLDTYVEENKQLKEQLDKANNDNKELKDKYEGDSFGSLSQHFGAKQDTSKGDYEDFSTYFKNHKLGQ